MKKLSPDEALGHIQAAYEEMVGKPCPTLNSKGEVFADMTFEELDLDSLEIVDLSIRVEEKVGFHIPGPAVDGARTVADLVKAITNGNT